VAAVTPAAVPLGQVQLPFVLPPGQAALEQQQQAACALPPGPGIPHAAQQFVS
jgi:hypothetical protein